MPAAAAAAAAAEDDAGAGAPSSLDQSGGGGQLRGVTKWIWEYRQARPGLDALQAQVDEAARKYAQQQQQEEDERRRQAEADEDEGWTVISRKGRGKKRSSHGVIAQAATEAVRERAEKRAKSKLMQEDFYRFQKREKRRNELMTLQQRFEQDKKKIQELKDARKFRPC